MAIETGKKYKIIAADNAFKEFIGKEAECKGTGATGMYAMHFDSKLLYCTEAQLEAV